MDKPQAPRHDGTAPRAVLIDAYGTLFDVHSVALLAGQLFPGHGAALSVLWRDKQIEYTRLVTTTGMGLPPRARKSAPVLVRHVLPGLIFARIASVRAWGDLLPNLTLRQFHQLRIQFKELRYTLGFFEPLLSECAAVLDLSRRIQEHLGQLNDASVGLELLADMRGCPDEAAAYTDFLGGELARLMADFLPLYAEFDRPEVRRALALAVVN